MKYARSVGIRTARAIVLTPQPLAVQGSLNLRCSPGGQRKPNGTFEVGDIKYLQQRIRWAARNPVKMFVLLVRWSVAENKPAEPHRTQDKEGILNSPYLLLDRTGDTTVDTARPLVEARA